jgi:hypothetical protein
VAGFTWPTTLTILCLTGTDEMEIVTADPLFDAYSVSVIW